MSTVEQVLGTRDEERFAARATDPLRLTASEAGRPRVRRTTSGGRDLALALPRGTFLHEGDVLHDDGATVVVVERTPEPALVVPLPQEGLAAVALGWWLGNQHSPVDSGDGELRVPLLTGEATALASLQRLGLTGEVREVPLARHGWWRGSSAHEHS